MKYLIASLLALSMCVGAYADEKDHKEKSHQEDQHHDDDDHKDRHHDDDDDNHRKKQLHSEDYHKEYTFGEPIVPTMDWIFSSGGRLYDNWMTAQEKDEVETTHPSWPKSNTKKSGAVTWRCKSCHGWDYKGIKGKYASGSYATGITGIFDVQGNHPDLLVAILRNSTHQYTEEMISDKMSKRIGHFIAYGLHDTDDHIDRKTGDVVGDAARGAAYFQNVCAACHGFQGTQLDWGDDDGHNYVGTEANANPWEVLHKLRNGHPGHEMVSMRPFSMKVAVDLLTYVKTLPEK